MRAYHNKVYQDVLKSAQVMLPDGVGLLWAAKILGKPLQGRITGVDFMEKLCHQMSNRGLTVGFVGGRNKVAERTADCLKKRYPNLTVAYAAPEWGLADGEWQVVGSKDKTDLKGSDHKLHATRHKPDIDILFVAYGAPKQEEWIHENLPNIPVRSAMGVGGAFDYISGEVSRAPKGMQKVGLEWMYRLVREPWRFRRQMKLVEFMRLVLAEKISRRNTQS